jgi:hypothetical protein
MDPELYQALKEKIQRAPPAGARMRPQGGNPRTIRLIVILALSALFVPLAACHAWSSRVPARAPIPPVTEASS